MPLLYIICQNLKVARRRESQKNGKFLKDFTGTIFKGPLLEGAGSRSETGGVCARANQLPPALRATPLDEGGFMVALLPPLAEV